MHKILRECFRVLKKEGILFIKSADTVFSQETYVSLAGLLQKKIVLDNEMYLLSRNYIFYVQKTL